MEKAEKTPTTIRNLLKYNMELEGTLRKPFLRLLADYSEQSDRKALLFLCSKQGMTAFGRLREYHPTLLDILTTFPTAMPPIERLLDVLLPHQPRHYSLVNTQKDSPCEMHFVFNVVEYQHMGRRRTGICTGWLDSLAGSPTNHEIHHFSEEVNVFPRNTQHPFRLPEDPDKPIIMIGAGTGVAPFVGFLRQGVHKAWLFYGTRHPDHDVLFKEELAQYKENLRTTMCYSRAEPLHPKLYVQQALLECQEEVWQWIADFKAVVYVCGDARGMALGVDESLREIAQNKLNLSKPEAIKWLIEQSQNGLYLRDVWA